jgi:nitroreductase
MSVKQTIEKRRAYRSLKPVPISPELLQELAHAASLTPSCYNKQPWRFVAVYDQDILDRIHEALPKGNAWVKDASMIIAVCSRKDLDCVIGDRDYYLFDTGMATAFMLLRATELNLVAHPIAGYKPKQVSEILCIPEDMTVITLVAVGGHTSEVSPRLNEEQAKQESQRPPRMNREKFFFLNRYSE